MPDELAMDSLDTVKSRFAIFSASDTEAVSRVVPMRDQVARRSVLMMSFADASVSMMISFVNVS